MGSVLEHSKLPPTTQLLPAGLQRQPGKDWVPVLKAYNPPHGVQMRVLL